MRIKRLAGLFMVLLLNVGFLVGCAAASDDGGKIPITTASEEARKAFLQGRELQEKLRIQESRQHFQKAVAEDPNFALAHYYLALAQPSAKEFFESLDQAVSSVDKVSEGEKLWILGFEAGVNGKPMQQREYYTKLVENYPNDERAHNLLGGHYFGQQEHEKAIARYEKAIAIQPEFSQPYNQMGYAYRFLGKYDESEQAFKKYIELIPDDPNPYDSYAELMLKLGKYDASIEKYRKALSVDPNFVASYLGIATNLNFKGEHEHARKELDKLYGIAANDGQRRGALFGKVVSYADEGDFAKALETVQEQYALAEKINDAANMAADLNTMGNILLEQDRPDAAKEKFDKSLAIMQNSDLGAEQKTLAEQGHLFNLSRVALAKNDLAGAKKHAQEYKKQAEARNNRFQIWAAHQLGGMIALAEKDYAAAVAELQQSNLQNPRNLYRLALAYEGKGDKQKAQEYFEKVKNYNALNSLQYAFVRSKDDKMITMK